MVDLVLQREMPLAEGEIQVTTPKWAEKIIGEVCDRHGIPQPVVIWRRRQANYSTGRAWHSYGLGCWNGRIVITAGKERADAKMTLLHELAHIIAPKGEHHSKEFYTIAFRLYRMYKLPMNKCKRREYAYKPRGAKQGYLASRRELQLVIE